MDDDIGLYDAFCELLHEVPEAESPLRAYREAQAKKAVLAAIERKRREELDDAYAALLAMRRPATSH
jgi:hypothetical protein